MSNSFFKKMFGGLPQVQLLTFDPEDNFVLLKSNSELSLGEHQVAAELAGEKLTCRVVLESFAAGTYYGRFLSPAEAIPYMVALLPQPAKFVDNREAPRIDRVLRVFSTGPQGFQTTSSDLSVTGMKIKLPRPFNVGHRFQCELEVDDYTLAQLHLNCEVRWCNREPDGKFQAGVVFVDMDRATRSRLVYFVDSLTRMERGVVKDQYGRMG